ncbi:MAG: SusC/RagA family TonB-linked outer membrane protein [Porphyromonas sp.]|nr:SusC/RagA family TonB-linked outer membrane protein [Porphyromonas sp.]
MSTSLKRVRLYPMLHLFILMVAIGLPTTMWAQDGQSERRVSGVLRDEAGLAIPGASVFAPASSRGTATSVDGTFSLSVPATEKKLVITFIGMKTEEVTLVSGKNYYEITLRDDVEALDEVVVTGYQTISKERTTGSFVIITQDDIKKKLDPNILQRLEGTIAGVSGRSYDNMTVRGVATLMGNSRPLLVVDGMPLEGELSLINPATIESITVLKDAAAASIYGARAANGVIVISTVKGSSDSRFSASYDGSILLTSKPSFDHLHRMSSRDLVDMSMEIVERTLPSSLTWSAIESYKTRFSYPIELYTKHNEGLLTDAQFEAELERIRNTENSEQIRDELLRVGALNVHNLTLMKGGDKSNYVATINYRGDRPTSVLRKSDELGYTLRNLTTFSDRLSADISVSGSYGSTYADQGSLDALGLLYQYPSYVSLVDENGEYLALPNIRSDFSLNQLLERGLEDETYNPLRDRSEEWNRSKYNYTRINSQLNYNILPELRLTGSFQVETSTSYSKSFMSPKSYTVRQMRNDATINENGEYVSLIPKGGQLSERRSSSTSYTGRLQMYYDAMFDNDHRLTALGGAEIRRIHGTATGSYLMGYDDISLGSVPYDAHRLSNLRGTQSMAGYFTFNDASQNYVRDNDDRFVSFYSNFAYEYLGRYNLTGSIRIDQSNLFGVDPKVQYRPLWSLGGSWAMHQEDFMSSVDWLNRLVVRLTYGIGGNIPKVGGPYMIVKTGQFNNKANVTGSTITTPPNRSLTWERTATTNLGLDYSVLGNRISGSFEFYNRHTSNLLGYRQSDPTIGWANLLMNYGTMLNRGFEMTLRTVNVKSAGFRWSTDFVYSYNHNKILDIDERVVTVDQYINNGVQTSGKPTNSLYSFEWAGLYDVDEDGNRIELGEPHIYVTDRDGNRKVGTSTNNMDDLTWEGTMTPKWSGGLTNTLEYKGLSLSCTFVFYGGHKLRDVVAPYMQDFTFLSTGLNVDRSIANAWKKEGDELLPGTTPKLTSQYIFDEHVRSWYGANIHVIPGDYLRMRNLVLAYSLPESFKSAMNVTDCTLRFQADNLFYIARNNSDLDPEAYSFGFGKPSRLLSQPRTFTFGLSLTF